MEVIFHAELEIREKKWNRRLTPHASTWETVLFIALVWCDMVWCGMVWCTFLSSLSFCLHTCASWHSLAMHNSTVLWGRASCSDSKLYRKSMTASRVRAADSESRVVSSLWQRLSSWCLSQALPFLPPPPFFIQCDKHLPLFLLFISTCCSSPPICEAIWSSVLSFVSVCSVFALWIHLTRLIEWTSGRYKLLILMGVAGRREVHCWLRADERTFPSVY